MIKSMRMTWERHAAHITDTKNTYKIFIRASDKYDISTAYSTYGKCKTMNIKF